MMKKLLFLLPGIWMAAMLISSAWALENEFSGEWYTRSYMQRNFTGEDETEELDLNAVYTLSLFSIKTRITENLAFVNTLGFEAEWGNGDGFTRIGTDGVDVYVEESYADFTLGLLNFKVGAQADVLARGFLFDDQFAGARIAYEGDSFSVPFYWVRGYEGGMGRNKNSEDVDYYGLFPSAEVGDRLVISPYLLWVTSGNASAWLDEEDEFFLGRAYDDFDSWYAGLDMDLNLDPAALWLTLICQFGKADVLTQDDDGNFTDRQSKDIRAWLAAVGGEVSFDKFDIHGQVFYASGQEDDEEDITAFMGPPGKSYYWASIMGWGDDFDDYEVSANSPGDAVSDIFAANIGTSFYLTERLELALDIWYAMLAEKDENGEDVLGTEVDLTASYELIENLNIDIIAAYLFAGDATYKGPHDANPYKLGAGLYLEF